MARISRTMRLKGAWLLVIPFFWWARPTPELLLAGAVLAAGGLLVRALAAGHIHKDRQLTVTGPYAHTRNPLYLGSFLLGLGVVVAGGRLVFVVIFLAFFGWVYSRVIRQEARHLAGIFGPAYAEYVRNVPLFVPRLRPWPGPAGDGERGAPASFSLERWRRNREYEALLGTVAGFVGLSLRMLAG